MAWLGRFLRETFIGRTDTYLTSAMRGTGVVDPLRDYFTQHQRDDTVTRLNRYYKNWRYYNRDHFLQPQSVTGEDKLVINYCRPLVDKSADWLMGRGFIVRAAEENDRVAELLESVWNDNGKTLLAWRAAQYGGVTGDAYFFVTIPWSDPWGNPVPPEGRKIAIQVLNPSFVHPKFSSAEERTVVEALIQYPVERKRYSKLGIPFRGDQDFCVYSQYINGQEIREFVDDSEIAAARRPNILGQVPLVHVQNLPHPGFFGMSDIDDIVPLNQELDEVYEAIRKIIKYQAEPTTMIFGAKVGNLTRGAGKVWSGLPPDAKVETLKLDANLTEILQYRDALKLAIHELSCTPEQSLGKIQAISNTSDAALQTTYLPLIEKTLRKQVTYGQGIAAVNKIILAYIERYFGFPVAEIAGNPNLMYETTVDFPSPLPRDENAATEIAIRRKDAGLESEAGALRYLGAKNITTKAIEILADRRAKLLRDAEATKAAMGQMPNAAVDSIGSLGMLPGVAEAFQEQDMQLAGAMRQLAEQEAAAAAAQAGAKGVE